MKSITKTLLESLNEEEVISNNELSGELYDYMLSEVDYDIDRHGKVEYVYTPTYEQFNDNIAEISEEDFNKLRKDIEEALYRTKFYNDTDGSGYYIELNDNQTMWELSNENKTAEDWTAIVQAAAAKFEEETGVELKFLGRSGRHVCVDVTADNLMGYNKLQEVQERLEQECIDEFNEEPLTESVNTNDAVSFVNEKIAFLKDNQDYDGAWLNLDDKYALVVCWEEGFDAEDPDVIHAKDNPEYALCLSIRERNEADLPSYWSLPFDKNGEPIIDSVSIRDNEDLTSTINSLLDEYNKMVTKPEEQMNESEDVARDLAIEPGSDEEATLNSLYDETTEDEGFDIDLAGDKVMEMFNTYGLSELTFHEIENEFIEGLNTFSDIMIVCADLEEKGKVTYDRDNNKIFRKMNEQEQKMSYEEFLNSDWLKNYIDAEFKSSGYETWSEFIDNFEKDNVKSVRDDNLRDYYKDYLHESEEVKEDKKVVKFDITVLPTLKFLWAEGNQTHIANLFGSAEEHEMNFNKFQEAVYLLDDENHSKNNGYDKVKYVANIHVVTTYEDGTTDEEDTTYTGRVDCGDGHEHVNVIKNMKYFIESNYKGAEVNITAPVEESLEESSDPDELAAKEISGKLTLKDYAMNLCGGEIDKDVSDVDIDMLVAFVYNFNNTPEDNYDKFLEILGERAIVVKDNEWNLVCDFTSVFKPYEEQLRDVFNMEYSEFDEAYYEAVDNLEGLVSGMVGEKTYETLVNILNGNK